jgi:hypothetical protein
LNKANRIRTELLALESIQLQSITNIQTLLLHLEGKGKSPRTIRAYEQNLKALAQRANLQNPEEVELAIARYKRKKINQPITNNYKTKLCDCYNTYCKFYKLEWEKPIYTPEPSSISPPTQERILMLIASSKRELSLKLDISYQTGLRPIEVHGLTSSDLHPDTQTLTARSHKKCNARPAMKITPELVIRIQQHINNKQQTTQTERPSIHRRRKALRRTLPQIQKQTRGATKRPVNKNNQALRPQTRLLHQTTP